MKKRDLFRYLCLAAASLLLVAVAAADARATGSAPVLNKGKKWRIGYLEGGPYVNYRGSLSCTVQLLMDRGWIEKADLPRIPDSEDTTALWAWLSDPNRSRYLEFPADAYWSSEWRKEKRKQDAARIAERMRTAADIDLFLAMGTWAGQDLAPRLKDTPVVVMSCSDPVQANIVASEEDSGKDNVHAWCDPTRFARRWRLFHDILGFQRLGLIYEDTQEGRIFANLSSIRQVARERGFEVVACKAPEAGLPLEKSRENAALCIEEMAAKIDAFSISDHRGLHPMHFPGIIAPLLRHRVAVFTAVRGPDLVSRGVLMGIARSDFRALGGFYAEIIARILNGARPRDLSQIFEEPIKLAINLETARAIGYEIPPHVREIADILYDTIDRSPIDQ